MVNTTETLLERERKKRGLTQRELGEVLGVSEQAAGRYCLGLRAPRRGKDGKPGPAERLASWSGGKIHAGNYSDPAAPRGRAKPKGRRS